MIDCVVDEDPCLRGRRSQRFGGHRGRLRRRLREERHVVDRHVRVPRGLHAALRGEEVRLLEDERHVAAAVRREVVGAVRARERVPELGVIEHAHLRTRDRLPRGVEHAPAKDHDSRCGDRACVDLTLERIGPLPKKARPIREARRRSHGRGRDLAWRRLADHGGRLERRRGVAVRVVRGDRVRVRAADGEPRDDRRERVPGEARHLRRALAHHVARDAAANLGRGPRELEARRAVRRQRGRGARGPRRRLGQRRRGVARGPRVARRRRRVFPRRRAAVDEDAGSTRASFVAAPEESECTRDGCDGDEGKLAHGAHRRQARSLRKASPTPSFESGRGLPIRIVTTGSTSSRRSRCLRARSRARRSRRRSERSRASSTGRAHTIVREVASREEPRNEEGRPRGRPSPFARDDVAVTGSAGPRAACARASPSRGACCGCRSRSSCSRPR